MPRMPRIRSQQVLCFTLLLLYWKTCLSSTPVPTNDQSDCSFKNLRKIIGHDNYSLLGILENCAIFYVTGDKIGSEEFNIFEIEGKTRGCYSPQPIFYKQKNQYKILVAQKTSIFLNGCYWNNSSNVYQKCDFERQMWTRRSIKPSYNDDDEIIGHFADVHSDILHVIYKNEKSDVFDAMYNLSALKFVNAVPLMEQHIEELSYDSDLKKLYYVKSVMGYREISTKQGIFSYNPKHKPVPEFNFSQGARDFFSFSNQSFIIRKDSAGGRVKYYAGFEGSSISLCFLEANQTESIKLTLFVDGGVDSAYQRIRAQLMPEVEETPSQMESSTEAIYAKDASTKAASLTLILPLIYLIS